MNSAALPPSILHKFLLVRMYLLVPQFLGGALFVELLLLLLVVVLVHSRRREFKSRVIPLVGILLEEVAQVFDDFSFLVHF